MTSSPKISLSRNDQEWYASLPVVQLTNVRDIVNTSQDGRLLIVTKYSQPIYLVLPQALREAFLDKFKHTYEEQDKIVTYDRDSTKWFGTWFNARLGKEMIGDWPAKNLLLVPFSLLEQVREIAQEFGPNATRSKPKDLTSKPGTTILGGSMEATNGTTIPTPDPSGKEH